jgi:hypothetical protein
MSWKTLLVMSVVLLALMGYTIWVEIPTEQAKQEADFKSKRVFDFDIEEVRALTLAYKDPPSEIILERGEGDGWRITKPLPAEGDSREIKSLINTVHDLNLRRTVDENAPDLSAFGLDRPSIRIRFTAGDKEEQLLVGNEGLNSTVYVKRGSDNRVMLADDWIQGSLTRTLYSLRKKQILTMDRDKADRLELRYGAGEGFVLAKKPPDWWIQKPIETKADKDTVSNLLVQLENLKASSFIDTGQASIRTRLGRPLAEARVEQAGRAQTVLLYRPAREIEPEPQTLYAVVPTSEGPERPIYKVTESVYRELTPDLFGLRDKHLVLFSEEAVQAVEVRRGDQSYTLVREKDRWEWKDEPGTGVKQEEADRFLSTLGRWKADEPLKDAKAPRKPADLGLDPPEVHIKLLGAASIPLAELRLGLESDQLVYALGEPSLGITRVRKDLLDEIPLEEELTQPPKQP